MNVVLVLMDIRGLLVNLSVHIATVLKLARATRELVKYTRVLFAKKDTKEHYVTIMKSMKRVQTTQFLLYLGLLVVYY